MGGILHMEPKLRILPAIDLVLTTASRQIIKRNLLLVRGRKHFVHFLLHRPNALLARRRNAQDAGVVTSASAVQPGASHCSPPPLPPIGSLQRWRSSSEPKGSRIAAHPKRQSLQGSVSRGHWSSSASEAAHAGGSGQRSGGSQPERGRGSAARGPLFRGQRPAPRDFVRRGEIECMFAAAACPVSRSTR